MLLLYVVGGLLVATAITALGWAGRQMARRIWVKVHAYDWSRPWE